MENDEITIYLWANLKFVCKKISILRGRLSLKVGGFALVWLDLDVLDLFCFCFLQVLRVEWCVCASFVNEV
jgi:hypothetical protein